MLKLNELGLTSLKEYCAGNADKMTKTKQLDVSNNSLVDLEGIEEWSDDLKWLNASHNQIKRVKHLKCCCKINVLNLSYNKISSVKHVNKLKGLNALILNNNEIKSIDSLSMLTELNTLVLSSNNLENIDVTSLKQLQKFSASHNELTEFPMLLSQKDLKDLKLNNNKIAHIPNWFVSSCNRMKILDLGNNELKDLSSIKCLCELPYLENLNLKGNPLCSVEDYHIKMKEMFPKLKILDFKKLSDLYFKAIECKDKRPKEASVLKDNKVSNTLASIGKISEVINTLRGTDPGNKHGFKSKKVALVTESNENVLSDSMKNKLDAKSEDITGNLDAEDKTVESMDTAKNPKKAKKRKHSTTNAIAAPDIKKGEETGSIETEDLSVANSKDDHTIKIKRNEKKKKSDKKSSKTSGVVSIIKTVSGKKSKGINVVDLDVTSDSFGKGETNAWT